MNFKIAFWLLCCAAGVHPLLLILMLPFVLS